MGLWVSALAEATLHILFVRSVLAALTLASLSALGAAAEDARNDMAHLAGLSSLHEYYLSHGEFFKAAQAAGAMMQYARVISAEHAEELQRSLHMAAPPTAPEILAYVAQAKDGVALWNVLVDEVRMASQLPQPAEPPLR